MTRQAVIASSADGPKQSPDAPCWGGAEIRREKLNMLWRGERVTGPCHGQLHDVPMGAEALVGL